MLGVLTRETGVLCRAANIIGRAALVYWPLGLSNDGLLPDEFAVFSNVHQTAHCTSFSTGWGCLNVDGMLLLVMPGLFVVFSHSRKRSSHPALRKRW